MNCDGITKHAANRHQTSSRRANIDSLPSELFEQIVSHIVRSHSGSVSDGVSLAATNRTLYKKVKPYLYEQTIQHNAFSIIHWAAEHNRQDVLKLAISYGADPNRPLTFIDPGDMTFSAGPEQFCPDHELDRLIKQRVQFFLRHYNHLPYTFYRDDTYAEVSFSTMVRLVDYYQGYRVLNPRSRYDPLLAAADTPAVKRIFLGCFCYWTTPLHIALASAHCNANMIQKLVEYGADINGTSYGICGCREREKYGSTSTDAFVTTAYSPLHSLECRGKLAERHQLLLQGPSIPSFLCLDRSMLARGSQLVKPVMAAVQPHNILHEVILSESSMDRGAQYIKALVKAGDRRILLEQRDAQGKLPVELAMDLDLDLEFVEILLSGREDIVVQTEGNEACSVLIWAILAGHLQYADYLLPHNPVRQRPARHPVDPAAVTTTQFSALHAVCTWVSWDIQGVAFAADQTGAFPLTRSVSRKYNHRKVLLENIIKTDAAKQQVNLFSAAERTPLTEALVWVATEPWMEVEELVWVLLRNGASPFAGIKNGLKSPIEYFLDLIYSSRKYNVRTPSRPNDHDCMEQLLHVLNDINIASFESEARALGISQSVFEQLAMANTNFDWVPQVLKGLDSLRS